jgi:hypothetical protein
METAPIHVIVRHGFCICVENIVCDLTRIKYQPIVTNKLIRIPLTHYPQRGGRDISDISPRRLHFTK